MSNEDIVKLAKDIIKNEGNFSNMDFKKHNVPYEYFLRLSLLSRKNIIDNCKNIINHNL